MSHSGTIVGIDPSLSRTAVYWGTGGDVGAVQCFSTQPSGPGVLPRIRRFETMVSGIADLLDTIGPVAGVFIEGYAMGARFGRETAGEYGGILRWHLLDFTDLVVEVAPSQLKKFCCGKGNTEGKDMVIAHLTSRYQVVLGSNDEYDAFGLYQVGRAYLGCMEQPTGYQQEVIAAIQKGKAVKPRGGKNKHPVRQPEEPAPF